MSGKCCLFAVFSTFHLFMASSCGVMAVKTPLEATCSNVTLVTVDPASIAELEGFFRDLQMALDYVACNTAEDACFNVRVTGGNYTLNQPVIINSNIILRGDNSDPVFVSIDVNQNFSTAFYPLLFQGVNYVEIDDIRFERSPGALGFENVVKVVINGSSFRWFAQGAVDIFQCFTVQISDCLFEHNGPVAIARNYSYRGHSGGVSVGLDCGDNCSSPNEVGLSISNCRFHNNTSGPRKSAYDRSEQSLVAAHFPGRGGALAIIINSNFEYNVSIVGCRLEGNHAFTSGSGIFTFFTGYSPHHMMVRDTVFTKNTGSFNGAIVFAYIEGSNRGSDIRLEVYNSRFTDNRATFGGGIFIFSGDSIQRNDDSGIGLIDNCTFEGNFADESGAAVSASSTLFATGEKIPSVTLTGCTFHDNAGGRGGVVTTGYLPLIFEGNNIFTNNSGRVLVVIGTRVEVKGRLLLDGNDGGGAIYTTSFSQLELHPGGSISLLNNIGVFGAALIVNNMVAVALPRSYRHVYNNPLCVLRHMNSTLLPDSWENVSMTFSGNSALYGSSILISGLDLCLYPGGNLQQVFGWNFIDHSDNTNTAHAPYSKSPDFFVETFAVRIEIMTNETSAYPGQEILVRYTGYDEFERPTVSAIRLSSEMDIGESRFLFSPSVNVPEIILDANITASYRFMGTEMDYGTIIEDQKMVLMEALFTEVPSKESFNLTLAPCPVGYELVSTPVKLANRIASTVSCECALESNLAIMNCNEERSKLLIRDGVWAAQAYDSETKQKTLFTHHCPGEYCRHRCFFSTITLCVTLYSPEEENRQCGCNREGVLCGSCSNGTGFSALLNKCVDCEASHISFLAAMVLADILVIGILLVLKVGPPAWLYPTLFYVQVVPYLGEGFQHTFAPFKPFALYFSSALSLYVAYDFCFLPKAGPIFMYSLRYIPFLLTVAITTVMVTFRYLYKLKRVPWYGVWWVTLLQYSHLVHTSINVLNCPKLPSLEDGHLSHRWYVDGDIECFTGFHTALSVLAIAVLTFCVLLIPVTFVYAKWYIKKPVLLSLCLRPLSAWFRDDLPWWPSVELTRRLVFVVLALVSSIIQWDYPVAMYLGISLVVFTFVQPYRHYLYNLLDTLLATGTLLLIMTRNSYNVDEGRNTENDVTKQNMQINTSKSHCEPNYAKLNWGILIFYYLPIVVFLISFVVAVLVMIKRLCSKCQEPVKTQEEDFANISYWLATNSAMTTDIVDTLPQGTLPMTTIMRQLNRRSSDEESVGGNSRGTRRYLKRRSQMNRSEQRSERRTANTGQSRGRYRWTSRQFTWNTYKHYLSKRLRKKRSFVDPDEAGREDESGGEHTSNKRTENL